MSDVLNRPSPNIPFLKEALKANLERLESEWETYQTTRDRNAIYGFLSAVFQTVMWWKNYHKAIQFARRALPLRGRRSPVRTPEPFAAVIFATTDPVKIDFRMRSKWSRVLRYSAEFKDPSESLRDFILRKGGINKCAVRYARRLGRRNRRPPPS